MILDALIERLNNKFYLDQADKYARKNTGCTKVHVGCVIVDPTTEKIVGIGANTSNPNCKKKGVCHRVEVYGDNSKEHRLPSDCNAVHSEISALICAGRSAKDCVAFVTRYPCEACARALAQAGIRRVVYGRTQEVSPLTKEIL